MILIMILKRLVLIGDTLGGTLASLKGIIYGLHDIVFSARDPHLVDFYGFTASIRKTEI